MPLEKRINAFRYIYHPETLAENMRKCEIDEISIEYFKKEYAPLYSEMNKIMLACLYKKKTILKK